MLPRRERIALSVDVDQRVSVSATADRAALDAPVSARINARQVPLHPWAQ
jgi:hypothetical protein